MITFILEYWMEFLLTIIVGMLGKGYTLITKNLKEERKEREIAIEIAKQLLKDRLRQANRYHLNNNFITVSDLAMYEELYSLYSAMGLNGVNEMMHGRVLSLEVKYNKEDI